MNFFTKNREIQPVELQGSYDVSRVIEVNASLARLRRTKNAMFAWEAIARCRGHNIEFPPVLVDFIEYVARSLVELGTSGVNDPTAEIKAATFGSETTQVVSTSSVPVLVVR